MTELEVIYREHFAFAWRALRRLGLHEPEIADAVQDVFLVVHRKLPEFEGRARLTTWLYGICLRVASRRRRARSALELREGDALAERAGDLPDPSRVLEMREAGQLMDRLLDAMPAEQRIVFTAFELEELTGEEIAELLGVPVATVHSRLRLARQFIRRALARLGARETFRTGAAARSS